MPLPVLLLNSTTGADTNSGAGPSTPITGTGASTSADGLTVTLPNADLTSVLVDGSHAILVNSRILMITAKGNSGTPTAFVTVANSAGASLTGLTYAIGGKRQTFYATVSVYNASLLAGWTVFLESGFSENFTGGQLSFTPSGSLTGNGFIYLLGASRDTVTLRHQLNVFAANVIFGSRWYIANISFINLGANSGGGQGINISDQSVVTTCRFTGQAAFDISGGQGMLKVSNSLIENNIVVATSTSTGTSANFLAQGDSTIRNNFIAGCTIGVFVRSGTTGTPYISNSDMGSIITGNKIVPISTGIQGNGNNGFWFAGRINNNIVYFNSLSAGTRGIALDRGEVPTRFFITNNCVVNAATGMVVNTTDVAKYVVYKNNFWNCTTQVNTTAPNAVLDSTLIDPNLTVTSEDMVVGSTAVLNLLNHFPAPTGGGGTFNPLQHPLIR